MRVAGEPSHGIGGAGTAMSSSSSGGASYSDFVGLAGSNVNSIASAAASSVGGSSSSVVGTQHHNQGMAGLLIMLAVLGFIFAYCCWGAPLCRSLCRRYCCCCCCCRVLISTEQSSSTTLNSESGGFVSNANVNNASTSRSSVGGRRGYHHNDSSTMIGTPTIILLPHGRMLVVDGTIFTQLQADSTGLDFVELGESVMRQQQRNNASSANNCRQLQRSEASIIEMDAETPSKDSMGSIGCFPPPTYESIYGKEETGDMPPSYSDILLHRLANLPFEIEDYGRDSKDNDQQRSSLDNCTRIISNPFSAVAYNNARRPTASNERNYSSLPRNSSLQSNPLDAYFVDNELAAATPRAQRRRSATALTSVGIARTRRTSCGEEPRTSDSSAIGRSENVIDDRFSNSWDQISRAPTDAVSEPEQHSSRANSIYSRSRRSTSAPEDDTVQVHRYPEARYISDEEQRDDSDDNADEEANNFKVLADIRESRV